jgi:Flp pilus assembly protein TadG
VRRLVRDEQGGALVEFALAAPMMLLLLFGAMEILAAVHAQQRVAHIAASIADVVARDSVVDDAELADLYAAAAAMIAPFPSNDLGQRISSFTADEEGNAELDWTSSGAAYAGSEPLALPPGYLQPHESVIVADVSYRYQPAMTVAFSATLPFQKRVYLQPRLSAAVAKR